MTDHNTGNDGKSVTIDGVTYFTVQGLADLHGCDVRTMRESLAKSRVKYSYKAGQTRYYKIDDLIKGQGDKHQPTNHAELRELLEARVPLGSIDTSLITSMRSLGSLLNRYTGEELRELKDWDVSAVTDFSFMFEGVEKLSADLSGWDVRNGEWFTGMFRDCTYFNSDISKWQTLSAQGMKDMFRGCTHFNSDISGWPVATVRDFSQMFRDCSMFNADLSKWRTDSAESMVGMFRDCYSFNRNLEGWTVARVKSFYKMFEHCFDLKADPKKWKWDRSSEMDYDDFLETLHRPDAVDDPDAVEACAVDDPDAGVDDPDANGTEEERK